MTINTGHEAETTAHEAYDNSEEAREIQAVCQAEREAHPEETEEDFVTWVRRVDSYFDRIWTAQEATT